MNIRNLATEMMLGRSLPALKFFEPKPRFLAWMKREYPETLIYDVGAGCGHVAEALQKKGLLVLGLDIHERGGTEGCPVLIADGETYSYEAGSVVMLCRPCHGEFAERVVERAITCKASTILYVGLEKNVKMDLGRYAKKFKLSLKDAGLEGEKIWTWTMKE